MTEGKTCIQKGRPSYAKDLINVGSGFFLGCVAEQGHSPGLQLLSLHHVSMTTIIISVFSWLVAHKQAFEATISQCISMIGIYLLPSFYVSCVLCQTFMEKQTSSLSFAMGAKNVSNNCVTNLHGKCCLYIDMGSVGILQNSRTK